MYYIYAYTYYMHVYLKCNIHSVYIKNVYVLQEVEGSSMRLVSHI